MVKLINLPAETPRLTLRPFRETDIAAFAAYRSDPEVARYQGWDAPYTIAQATGFVAAMQRARPGEPGEWYQVAITLKDGRGETAAGAAAALIGDCAFHLLKDDLRQAEIGYTLARAYQGRGYAVEAVGWLVDELFRAADLHRIRAICDAENPASAHLLERLGFRREAHFIENLWFKGRWSSEFWYGLLRQEWQARQNGR